MLHHLSGHVTLNMLVDRTDQVHMFSVLQTSLTNNLEERTLEYESSGNAEMFSIYIKI